MGLGSPLVRYFRVPATTLLLYTSDAADEEDIVDIDGRMTTKIQTEINPELLPNVLHKMRS